MGLGRRQRVKKSLQERREARQGEENGITESIHFIFAYTEEGEESGGGKNLLQQVFLLYVRSWERTRGGVRWKEGKFLGWEEKGSYDFIANTFFAGRWRGEEEAILEEGKRVRVLGSYFVFIVFVVLLFMYCYVLLLYIFMSYYFYFIMIFAYLYFLYLDVSMFLCVLLL